MQASFAREQLCKVAEYVQKVTASNNWWLMKWEGVKETDFVKDYRDHNGDMDAVFECLVWNAFRHIRPEFFAVDCANYKEFGNELQSFMALAFETKLKHDYNASDALGQGVEPVPRCDDELCKLEVVQSWIEQTNFPPYGHVMISGIKIDIDKDTHDALKRTGLDGEYRVWGDETVDPLDTAVMLPGN